MYRSEIAEALGLGGSDYPVSRRVQLIVQVQVGVAALMSQSSLEHSKLPVVLPRVVTKFRQNQGRGRI